MIQHILLGANFTLFLSIINFQESNWMSISAMICLIMSSFFHVISFGQPKYKKKETEFSLSVAVILFMLSLSAPDGMIVSRRRRKIC